MTSNEDEIKQALGQPEPRFPAAPLVERLVSRSYEDSSGENSLLITVILSDSTRDEELTGEHVLQIKSAIRERLQNAGIALFPYVRFVTSSEFNEQAA